MLLAGIFLLILYGSYPRYMPVREIALYQEQGSGESVFGSALEAIGSCPVWEEAVVSSMWITADRRKNCAYLIGTMNPISGLRF